MRRSRVLALVVAGVLVIAAVGWVVGSRLRSPAEEAASRRPPKPSLVTSAVERRKLTSTVTVSGTLTYGSPLPITLAGMVGGNGGAAGAGPGGGANGAAQRVTTAPKPGPSPPDPPGTPQPPHRPPPPALPRQPHQPAPP
ncbi:hypothetical protein AB0K48_39870, partial [Nonomuraea sp. NPDC055795]